MVDERRSVIEAVLNLGHIPVGMEAFQASDDTQWDYIKRRIDDSDYYVLIVAERYGSELKGKSYTQMEYEYAVAQDPLHSNDATAPARSITSHGSCCAANCARKDDLKSAASLPCHARARRPSPEAYEAT
ncbi:DUF4062 domain-containing protein [Mesorhizobium sp. ISC25]|uniref:DUF4062 domain-containing protein n=1 Tax=Mesorhizobium sp. ISC25 TaxID=3077335 RepID=UPI0035D7E6C8